MHKIIAEKFEIDLSTVDITTTDENAMFLDKYTTKYSFPFSLELTNENQRNFQDLLDHCSKEITTEFDIVYIFGNIKEAGILRVDTFNETINCELQYGIEEFPNFNKKLNELELQKLTTPDVYAHAKTIITKTWPEVNYNYPQIHTDRYDTTQATWEHFLKIFNNYVDGDFITNEVVSSTPQNKNLMLPLPYYMHILTQGFAQAGYTLKGDVLTISSLQKKLLYGDCDYNKILNQIDINTVVFGADRISSSGNQATYKSFVTLPSKGRYRVIGTAYIYGVWEKRMFVNIKYRGQTLFEVTKKERRHHSGRMYSYNIDFTFDTINDSGLDELEINSTQFLKDDIQIIDMNTSSLFLYNELGVAIPNIVQNNDVDLNRVVPDVTFGKFVTSIKNWYNLSLYLKEKDIYMDFVHTELNYDNATDLSEFEVVAERTYEKKNSFVLKFNDATDEKNNFPKVFFDVNGMSTSGFTETEKTNTIEIDAFPLTNTFRNGVQTAYAVESEKSKMYALLYGGLDADDLNLTQEITEIVLPYIVPNYYQEWLFFRIESIGYRLSFNSFTEGLKNLKALNKIFNFGRFFIIKTLIKRQVRKDLHEVEVECYTLK